MGGGGGGGGGGSASTASKKALDADFERFAIPDYEDSIPHIMGGEGGRIPAMLLEMTGAPSLEDMDDVQVTVILYHFAGQLKDRCGGTLKISKELFLAGMKSMK